MITRVVEVSDKDSVTYPAQLAVCTCGSECFFALQIAGQKPGQKHWHLQCTACGESYCPEGACVV